MRNCTALLALTLLVLSSCSPLTSSPYDGKYQLELTLHEVQTNLDDVRHDLNTFRSEIQIIEGHIKHNEQALASLKNQDFEKAQSKIDQLTFDVQALEKKWSALEKSRLVDSGELKQLSSYARETGLALIQFKDRIGEMEQELISGQRRFEEIGKLKSTIESLAKSLQVSDLKIYKVRSGDSLEKIAKSNKTTVEKIKKLNGMEQDLIGVGQDLKIPCE